MESAITEKTKVIIPVDLDGIPCNYDRIFDIKDYSNAHEQFINEITLPLYTKLTDEEIEYVIKNYCQIVKNYI